MIYRGRLNDRLLDTRVGRRYREWFRYARLIGALLPYDIDGDYFYSILFGT